MTISDDALSPVRVCWTLVLERFNPLHSKIHIAWDLYPSRERPWVMKQAIQYVDHDYSGWELLTVYRRDPADV